MKRLASCLSAVTFSLALASCSAGGDGAGDEPKFQEASESSENSVSTKPVELKEREPKDFFPGCLLYTSPRPRDLSTSRMPSSA